MGPRVFREGGCVCLWGPEFNLLVIEYRSGRGVLQARTRSCANTDEGHAKEGLAQLPQREAKTATWTVIGDRIANSKAQNQDTDMQLAVV